MRWDNNTLSVPKLRSLNLTVMLACFKHSCLVDIYALCFPFVVAYNINLSVRRHIQATTDIGTYVSYVPTSENGTAESIIRLLAFSLTITVL
jgi:hypothetical protein